MYYILQKLSTLRWIWNNREQFDTKENKLYQKFGVFLPFRSFITYTNFSNTLTFFNSFYFIIFNKPIYSFSLSIIWSLLFSVTVGYWVMVYPFLDNTLPINMKIEISGHGPLLLLYSVFLYFYQHPIFELQYILHTIGFNIFWLICIWFPWYLLTGDYIYFVFKPEFPFIFKVDVILKICLIGMLGFYMGYLIEFKV